MIPKEGSLMPDMKKYTILTEEQNLALIRRLRKPEVRIDVVMDTDTYNEIDDQFALSYLVRSDEKADVKAIYAAPFYNSNSVGPEDGMLKSYDEILHLLTLLGREDLKDSVYRGSEDYLPDEETPQDSDAARDLAARAMQYTTEEPLYVVATGAVTNVASAILMRPEIIDRIVVVWLGGTAIHWPHNREFNLMQDIAAARIIFGCGVPLVQLPCAGVVSAFTISGPELVYHLKGRNALCDYLASYTIQEAEKASPYSTWTRAIWDVTAVGWLLDGPFMEDKLIHSPIPEYDDRYAFDDRRHFIKYVYQINRDALMEDLFAKLRK